MGVGIYFAQLYMSLLSYRKLPDVEEKQKQFPVIHYIHNVTWTRLVMAAVGISLMVTDLTVARHAIAEPYSWSML